MLRCQIPNWGGGEPDYYGTVDSLYNSIGRNYLVGVSVGDYALIAGGWDNSYNVYLLIDVYDSSLVHYYLVGLSFAKLYVSGASVGNYALIGGGGVGGLNSIVDAFDTSLTKSNPTALSVARCNIGTGTVANQYALFAGGETTSVQSTVDAYSTSLARSTPTTLSEAREWFPTACHQGASVGDYVIFGGGGTRTGYAYNPTDTVDAYNSSLTRSTPTSLSSIRTNGAAASTENYALFGGGWSSSSSNPTNIVEAYNSSLTRSTPTVLSVSRVNLGSISIGGYAIFAGGLSSSTYYGTVDIYDSTLTRSTLTSLSESRSEVAGAITGNYAIFAGGINTTQSAAVDVYTI